MKNIIITAGLLILFASCTKQEMPQPATKQTSTSATLTNGANAKLSGASASDNIIKPPTNPTPTPPPPPPPPPAPGPDTPPTSTSPTE